MTKSEIQNRIKEIEKSMNSSGFWSDKDAAQAMIREMQELQDQLEGVGKFDKGNAVVTLLSGAGGQDAEDFTRMLYEMYRAFCENKNWDCTVTDKNETPVGGYKSITFEVSGKGVYGDLKFENGVHRLVRISPFNAQGKRQTSFALVEIVPLFENISSSESLAKAEDLDIQFSKSGGPGGQNVNKRETAVRITHKPTGIQVRVTEGRTQEVNKQKAIQMIEGKLAALKEQEQNEAAQAFKVNAGTKVEWGSQMRSYVLHPYKLVKDHRTNHEIGNVEKVMERGEIDELINAMREFSSAD